MKIEFRKVPQTEKELLVSYNSVTLEGTFSRISSTLVRVNANMAGKTDLDCIRCGQEEQVELDEKLTFLISDGIFKDDDSEELVIEVENHIIDFDEIIESEVASIKSDYHICASCMNKNEDIDQEF